MTAHLKKIFVSFFAAFLFLFLAIPASAAAPDGLGPWADTVVSSSQANTKGGTPVSTVNPARSDPTNALGVAENDTVDSHFFSLGFGGSLTLGFDNGISSGVIVVEATNPGYPTEKAKVEVSENGTTWVEAGTVLQDGSVTKPDGVGCAKFVRLTDVSNPADFSEDIADAYDVDGVHAQGDACQPQPCGNEGCCDTTVTQTNNTVVKTVVVSGANTGGNTAKKNTGAGGTTIQTGNASSTVGVSVGGSSNTATLGCCGGGGNTNVTIENNGNGSKNIVKIGNSKKKLPH